jgi:protein-tyrosine-phosphatase
MSTIVNDSGKPSLKQSLRKLLPPSLVRERDIFLRLGPKAGPLYARLRMLDALHLFPKSSRKIPSTSRSVLFVCYGNIMRSPMAALMLQDMAQSAGLENIQARSAGIHAIPGTEAHPRALDASLEIGLPLTEHRARLLTPALVSQADVIFAMDFQNLAEMVVLYEDARQKMFMLSDYAEGPERHRQIADPFFGDLDSTRRCYRLLQTCIRNLVASLANTTGSESLPLGGLRSTASGRVRNVRS